MFYNGNNQAMQLALQGYSDSIKVNMNNGIGNSLRNFNETLAQAQQGYHAAEQAKANRALTQQQTRAYELDNEYSEKTMDNRVAMVGEQKRSMELQNEYSERTLDDRVQQESHRTKGMALDNKGKELDNTMKGMENKTYEKTQDTLIVAKNDSNRATSAQAKLSAAKDNLTRGNYEYAPNPMKDAQGNWYIQNKNVEGGKQYISEAKAQEYQERNQQVKQNRRTWAAVDTSGNESSVSANQAQLGQNQVAMNSANQALQRQNELQQFLSEKGITPNQWEAMERIALANGSSVVQVGDVEMPVGVFAQGYSASLGGGGGMSINNRDRAAVADKLADSFATLRDPNATDEQRARARDYVKSTKDGAQVLKLSETLSSFAVLGEKMHEISEADRGKVVAGYLTQYIGGDFAKAFGELKANESAILTGFATKTLTGTLSNQDMNIAKQQIPSLWKSNAHNMGVMKSTLDTMIATLEGKINHYGEGILTDKQMKQYKGLIQLRDIIALGKPQ